MGKASFTDISGRSATLTASGHESFTSSASGFVLDVNLLATVDALGAQWGANGEIRASCSLCRTFTLTAPSLLDLTATGSFQGGIFFVGAPFWILEGPSLFVDSSTFGFSGSGTFTADPGDYFLNYSLGGTFGAFPQGVITHQEGSESLSVTADFTPIVPEPKWSAAGPVVLMALILLVPAVRPRKAGF
jgi:hypothetical protein